MLFAGNPHFVGKNPLNFFGLFRIIKTRNNTGQAPDHIANRPDASTGKRGGKDRRARFHQKLRDALFGRYTGRNVGQTSEIHTRQRAEYTLFGVIVNDRGDTMKAFSFAGSLMSLCLYLLGGALVSFYGVVCGAWQAIKAVVAAALFAGLSVLEILAAVVAFVLGCIVGTGTLAYSAAYYIVVGIVAAAKWLFSADYAPEDFDSLY